MTVWDKLAEKYDSIWVQKYSLAPARREVLKRIRAFAPETVLDIGCGTGQLIALLEGEEEGPRCAGCDKSREMIRQAKRKNLQADFFVWDVCGDSPTASCGGSGADGCGGSADGCGANEAESPFSPPYDLIVCTHSFPYYPHKPLALKRIYDLMGDDSRAIFVQAAVNSLYDRAIMGLVEKTAEKADYLPKREFLQHTSGLFELEEQFHIKEKWFMPSICGFVLRKKKPSGENQKLPRQNKEDAL